MAEANYKSERVGVFGHPVAENPTIVMQEAAFRALGLNWRYLNIEVLPQDLASAMGGLRAMNFAGINTRWLMCLSSGLSTKPAGSPRRWQATPLGPTSRTSPSKRLHGRLCLRPCGGGCGG